MANKILNGSYLRRDDEFYTQLYDVETELAFYKELLAGKKVYCNCDDVRTSAFWEYFHRHFEELKLLRLTATHYVPQGRSFVSVYCGGNDDVVEDCVTVSLFGSGDFRSPECVELLEDSDVIVSNPPFSLYTEYVDLLIKSGKQFLILGNMNSVAYKTIFPLIKTEKLWAGVNAKGGTRKGNSLWFVVPKDYAGHAVEINGIKTAEVTAWWFTNIDHPRRHIRLPLTKSYGDESYPKLDNYEAIEVSRYKNIPCNYDGVMAVPVTYLRRHCPEQFEILGLAAGTTKATELNYDVPYTPFPNDRGGCGIINDERLFARILIRRKN